MLTPARKVTKTTINEVCKRVKKEVESVKKFEISNNIVDNGDNTVYDKSKSGDGNKLVYVAEFDVSFESNEGFNVF